MSAYTSTKIAEQLEIPQSTIRRWCKALELVGYEFVRHQNRRVFDEQAVENLKQLKVRMAIPGMTLEEACQALVLHSESEADQRDTSEAEVFQEAIVIFERKLALLSEEVYWLGAEQAIKQLQDAYVAVKESLDNQ